ncbi:MAG TPA: MarR family winged helix-turn-helix transcriptional regulator [Polyangia bacterium]|jgi:DNA-binding MarR family transcriptional regulator
MTRGDRFAALLSQVASDVVRRRSSEICCGELTLEQFDTLAAIDRSGGASIGSLAVAANVELSTMSRNISVLERNAHLIRRKLSGDRRIVHVSLTAKGQQALTTLRCSEKDVLGDVYERIAPEERAPIMKALEALRGCLVSCTTDAACCPPRALARKTS